MGLTENGGVQNGVPWYRLHKTEVGARKNSDRIISGKIPIT